MENITISENRLKHIIGVARECYSLSKEYFNKDDLFAKKMFIIGFNHDVGYEFTPTAFKHFHGDIGAHLIKNAMGKEANDISINAIKWHGNPKTPDEYRTLEWYILNIADMTINSKGQKVTMDDRIEDILKRQGIESKAYKDSIQIKEILETFLHNKYLKTSA